MLRAKLSKGFQSAPNDDPWSDAKFALTFGTATPRLIAKAIDWCDQPASILIDEFNARIDYFTLSDSNVPATGVSASWAGKRALGKTATHAPLECPSSTADPV
jgi:hypothetical protein